MQLLLFGGFITTWCMYQYAMASTVKNALTGGAVVGGGIVLVGLVAIAILGPLVTAMGWYLGWWSFEAAVIVMLLFVAYIAGGGE